MNPWTFFDRILVINLPNRYDRLDDFMLEFRRANMPYVIKIDGILDENPVIGFNKAQRNALEIAKGNTLILEDDVVIIDHEHLSLATKQLPEDWDILYLGANVVGTDLCNWPEPEYFSPHLRRVTQAWTTHAVAYSEKCVKWILKDWDYKGGQIYDDYLRCNLEKLNAFIIYPMIADQRPGYSDIWNRQVNYGFFNKWSQ